MSKSQKKGRGRPPRVASERILETALAVMAEDRGEVSIRKLARRLQIAPTAIYNRYPDKEAMVDAMAETMLGQLAFERPQEQAPWDTWLRGWMDRVRQTLLASPGLIYLYAYRLNSEYTVKTLSELIDFFADLGLPRRQAIAEAQGTIMHVLGFVNLEARALRPDYREVAEKGHRALAELGITVSVADNFEQVWADSSERTLLGIAAKIRRFGPVDK